MCAGMNGNSLQGAGGVGRAVADWIVDGLAPKHMLRFEVQRSTSLHNTAGSCMSGHARLWAGITSFIIQL